ncbi:uncharacterized protein FIBRA_01375 [Fibroporia radiculosa]|uniref:AB hydrolase-1 domain-containing protein n=1 Tax=Fibroporia radiculosa TaxID=599839 RepID=J4HT83_9APHY|nr:uncharacterized protein FIBRA_01375 [Fibroporia radiculosa]CCL99357.1 predicted protein [Fibroporia radiculosa]
MDPSLYKQLTTKRGFKYNYFVAVGLSSHPALVLIHGFPSTSYDWHHQVSFFREKGYTVIVPDTLGNGRTDKPTDRLAYKHSGMAADLVDILDSENVDKAIVIGHDWGSALVSRVANYYPERLHAVGFLSVGYVPPNVEYNYDASSTLLKDAIGYNPFGYWQFFVEDGASTTIKDHSNSFFDLIFPSDPKLWKEHLCTPGAVKAWLLADKTAPLVGYLTEEEKKIIKARFAEDGLAGGLNWYKVSVYGIGAEDDKQVSANNYFVQLPVFFGGCKADYAVPPAIALSDLTKYCPNRTVKEFDTSHWVQLETPDLLNRELLAWITDLKVQV